MDIYISEGEIIDRYTILEIKQTEIKDLIKKEEINKEIILYKKFDNIKKKYILYFKLLYFINYRIWNLQNEIKTLEKIDFEYAEKCNLIFEYNQSRFRIKDIINKMANSQIKEQKSYNTNEAFINIDNENEENFNNLIYLIFKYDKINVYFNDNLSPRFVAIIKSLFPILNYVGIKNDDMYNFDKIETNLINNFINLELKNLFNPIFYRAEGKLGDFILQLSIINEKFIESGRMGILYISNDVYKFTFPLEHTFKDTYDLVISQNYIQDFKIWNSEFYEINLSSWYLRRDLLFKNSWHNIFKNEYKINWGVHKWIKTKIEKEYNDKIVVTYKESSLTNLLINTLLQFPKEKLLLIGYSENDYIEFKKVCKLDIKFIKCKTIEDMAIIINNCHTFIGGLSSPLTLAQATHINTIALLGYGGDNNHNLLNDILPNYTIKR